MSDQTKPMLPGLPEGLAEDPEAWLEVRTGAEVVTEVRAIQLATWKAAMEHAATMIRSGDFCRYVDHVQGVCDCEEMAAAIRQAPEPGEGG